MTRFPRSERYHPDWLVASASGGANSLWLTEWLCEALPLERGMNVLDLGCGRAASSIFLHREFGVRVWAVDLWVDPGENLQRIRDAGCDDAVFPLRADTHSLPFAPRFFDAIVCIDSIPYFGTDDFWLLSIARLLQPRGAIAFAGTSLMQELDGPPPEDLREWWTPDLASLHSAAWWRAHWERSTLVDVETADAMPDGWQRWLEWHRLICPDNEVEIRAVEADAGRYLGYARAVARLREGVTPPEPIGSFPPSYTRAPLLR
ncbi:MAG TPA: methyltransferase domain-containing protein [Thermoanaerobaculia bacterium]